MLGFVGRDCGSTHVADDNRRSTTDSTLRVVDKGKQRLSVVRQSVCQRYGATPKITATAKRISFRGFAAALSPFFVDPRSIVGALFLDLAATIGKLVTYRSHTANRYLDTQQITNKFKFHIIFHLEKYVSSRKI